jgi:murein DD-endopeptidase MepM/ murein hydrolase activator NlpD
MNNSVRIAYTLKRGDSLSRVAQTFETSVDRILQDNKHIKPNKWMSGDVLSIEPGSIHNVRRKSMQNNVITRKQLDLYNKMRRRWQDLIFYSREAAVSILEDLDSSDLAVDRMLKTAEGIADVFAPYYSDEIVDAITSLIEEHLAIAVNLATALANDEKEEYKRYEEAFYSNADDIAEALSSINENYDRETVKGLLYKHLGLYERMINNYKIKQYMNSMRDLQESYDQAMIIADALSGGIVKEFKPRFE